MLNTYSPQNMTPAGSAALPGLPTRLTPVGGVAPTITWVRNPDWLAMPEIAATDVKCAALIRIDPESNFIACNCAGSLGYSVFWGDSNVACTFEDSGDTCTKVAHGLVNTDKVMFNAITTTTGISINTIYFVVNKTADTFQVSLTSGGSAIALTTDGTGYINIPEKVATTVQANHQYDNTTFDTTSLTAGYCTFTDSGDLVTRTNHGRSNNDVVVFYSITSTTGISINTKYYVINATTDTFQVSTTLGGSAATLTTDGSGTLLPYKQALMIIVPQNTGTLTSINHGVKHTQTSLQTYFSPILDLIISGSAITTLTLGSTIYLKLMERFSLLSSALTSYSSLFSNCSRLQVIVSIISSASVTTISNMFNNCYSLTTVPLFNTATVTSMNSMFAFCNSLTNVPLFNTAAVTDMSGMFSQCNILTTVPLFNTINVTTMSNMFNRCYPLTNVPLFNTIKVTTMNSMFAYCYPLTNVPLFNTAAVTDMSGMFNSCYSLTTVPLFNTAAVTNMSNMFQYCSSLTTVPLFNTATVTNMSTMFYSCNSLTNVPLFNTAAVTSMSYMFNINTKLKTVPLFNTAAVTTMAGMFSSSSSLTNIPLFNTASVINMSDMFSYCNTLTNVPLFNTAAVTTMSGMFTSCSSLISLPALNLSAVTTGNSPTMSSLTNLSSVAWTGLKFTHTYSGDKLSLTSINTILDNLGISSSQTVTFTNNWGSGAAVSKTSCGTSTGSAVITQSNTSSLAVGMEVTSTNIGGTACAIACTIQTAANTITFSSHGIPDGTKVALTSLTTSTGIAIKTIYYVVNGTANTFQLSLTNGGSAIDITGSDGFCSIIYPNTIASIITNTSFTMVIPARGVATETATAYPVGLRVSSGYMKGWTVTT